MSNDAFTVNGTTKFRLANGNQGIGKCIISDSNGKFDWSTANFGYDGWNYVSNVVASGQGGTIINLSTNTHHMVVNNQGDSNYATNKVRLVLPYAASTFSKVRVTLMSEPWEVYLGATASTILYSTVNEGITPLVVNKGPVSLSSFTALQWFPIQKHWTVEFTRIYYNNTAVFTGGITNVWVVTNCNGVDANIG